MPANERFHLAIAHQNVDHAALAQLNFVADGMLNIQNNNLVVPDWNLVGAVAGISATLAQVELVAPSLTGMWPMDIAPLDVAAEPSSPKILWDSFDNPSRFVVNEQLQVQTRNTGAAAVRQTVGLWLFPRRPTPIQSEIKTLRATGATTLAAYTWTTVPLVLANLLPAGRYALVGLIPISAGLIFARVIFVGGVYRPGCIAQDAIGDIPYFRFVQGNLGVWGEFDHNQVPSIECFSLSADTTQEFYLDLVKIG